MNMTRPPSQIENIDSRLKKVESDLQAMQGQVKLVRDAMCEIITTLDTGKTTMVPPVNLGQDV